MKSLGDILKLATHYLEKNGVARPRFSAEELLAHILKLKKLDLYMQFDLPVTEEELDSFRALVKRRITKEPVQYILKEMSFYHCDLEVTSDVLIPRQETEIFLDKICSSIASIVKNKIAWDVCTGSGALAIGLKKRFPELSVFASDISREALLIAKKNSERNKIDLSFYQGDLLTPFKEQKADFIICNPPYISEAEYLTLEPEVRDFEPRQALVGGVTGIEFYERLSAELPSYLNPKGRVFLEIGKEQGNILFSLFKGSFWKVRRLEKDWAGHDRFFFLECE